MSSCITTPSREVLSSILNQPSVKMTHVQACVILRHNKDLTESKVMAVLEKTSDTSTDRNDSLLLLTTICPFSDVFAYALKNLMVFDDGMRDCIQKQLIRTPFSLSSLPFDPKRSEIVCEYLHPTAIVTLVDNEFAVFPTDASMINPNIFTHYINDEFIRTILLRYGMKPSPWAVAIAINSGNYDTAIEWLGRRLSSPSTIKEVLRHVEKERRQWLIEISGISQ